jgi:DNA-binding PadR family transcriptional regulator
MSSIDLFLLGFFFEKKWSAYELAKFIDAHNLREMIKISIPATYKNIVKMEKKGYLKIEPSGETKQPQKKIYSLTTRGREHFDHLITRLAGRDVRYHLDFNSVVLNLDKISKGRALSLLSRFRKTLIDKREYLRRAREEYAYLPMEATTLVEQIAMLNETMISWVDDFRARYEER